MSQHTDEADRSGRNESGHLELKEHDAARLLRKDELESVNWLPAD